MHEYMFSTIAACLALKMIFKHWPSNDIQTLAKTTTLTAGMPPDAKHNPLISEHPSPHPPTMPATFGEESNTPT